MHLYRRGDGSGWERWITHRETDYTSKSDKANRSQVSQHQRRGLHIWKGKSKEHTSAWILSSTYYSLLKRLMSKMTDFRARKSGIRKYKINLLIPVTERKKERKKVGKK